MTVGAYSIPTSTHRRVVCRQPPGVAEENDACTQEAIAVDALKRGRVDTKRAWKSDRAHSVFFFKK